MKLTQTKEYLLFVDEKAEVCRGQHRLLNDEVEKIHEGHNYPYRGFKIIAYRKLNENAKELDLPLLPNPFEVDTEKLSYIESLKDFPLCRESFEAGYKAAQPKQFSLEDMYRVAIKAANKVSRPKYGEIININEIVDTYIQLISTQQLPKEFIPEYKKDWEETTKMLMESMGDNPEDFKYEETLKTITNSEGKEELVGTYKY